MSVNPDLTLISHVRRGSLNFELLVAVLLDVGYVTDTGDDSGLGLISTTIESARQEDFDALFSVLMSGKSNDIAIRAAATDKGGLRGVFSYALFNENRVSREEVSTVLEQRNKAAAQDL